MLVVGLLQSSTAVKLRPFWQPESALLDDAIEHLLIAAAAFNMVVDGHDDLGSASSCASETGGVRGAVCDRCGGAMAAEGPRGAGGAYCPNMYEASIFSKYVHAYRICKSITRELSSYVHGL